MRRKTDILIEIGKGIAITDCRKIEDTLTRRECKSCEDYDSVKDKCIRYKGLEKNLEVQNVT